MKNKIERLERQLAAIQSELDELKNQEPENEIDWSQMVGRLVEVRDYSEQKWQGPYTFLSYTPCCKRAFETAQGKWGQARLYAGPTNINWVKHDRSNWCPVDGDVRVLWLNRGGVMAIHRARLMDWNWVTHYSIIESNPQ